MDSGVVRRCLTSMQELGSHVLLTLAESRNRYLVVDIFRNVSSTRRAKSARRRLTMPPQTRSSSPSNPVSTAVSGILHIPSASPSMQRSRSGQWSLWLYFEQSCHHRETSKLWVVRIGQNRNRHSVVRDGGVGGTKKYLVRLQILKLDER